MSHRLLPLDLRLAKLSWPGVSIISRPGTLTSTFRKSLHLSTYSSNLFFGKKVAPICWVIPPASLSWTCVLRILSSNVVLPVSTWPKMQQMGDLNSFSLSTWNTSLWFFKIYSSGYSFFSACCSCICFSLFFLFLSSLSFAFISSAVNGTNLASSLGYSLTYTLTGSASTLTPSGLFYGCRSSQFWTASTAAPSCFCFSFYYLAFRAYWYISYSVFSFFFTNFFLGGYFGGSTSAFTGSTTTFSSTFVV